MNNKVVFKNIGSTRKLIQSERANSNLEDTQLTHYTYSIVFKFGKCSQSIVRVLRLQPRVPGLVLFHCTQVTGS